MEEITMAAAQAARLREARRRLANFRGFVHRQNLTGWTTRHAGHQFRQAFAAVLAYEDIAGVEACSELSNRLREIRVEAMARGLLDAGDVLRIEREECGL